MEFEEHEVTEENFDDDSESESPPAKVAKVKSESKVEQNDQFKKLQIKIRPRKMQLKVRSTRITGGELQTYPR